MKPRLAWMILTSLVVVASGCGVHLHDEGRLKVSQQAVSLSEEIRTGAGTPFATMETNLNTVRSVNGRVNAQLYQLTSSTFQTVLPALTQEELGKRIHKTVEGHENARKFIDVTITAAVADVEAALERNRFLDAPAAARQHDLAGVLNTVEGRLQTLNAAIGAFRSAADHLQGFAADAKLAPEERSAVTAIADLADKGDQDNALVKAANASKVLIDSIEAAKKDPQLKEARDLSLRAGNEIAAVEARALAEMRRHLAALQSIQKRFEARDKFLLDTLLLPNTATVDPNLLNDPMIKRVFQQRDPELYAYTLADPKRQERAADWVGGKTLAEFVHKRLTNYKNVKDDRNVNDEGKQEKLNRARSAFKLATVLTLIFVVESPKDRMDCLDVGTEMHLYSIRLSAINAEERMDLVHQLAQGVQIYHEGGITPQELAQLLLEASQVGALFDIAGKK